MAAPMTYAVNGEQFVAVQAGYGGAAITVGPIPPSSAARKYQNTNRIIAFKIGRRRRSDAGAARVEEPFEKPPPPTATQAQIDAGEIKFVEECSRCHVLGPSTTPDLRKLNAGSACSLQGHRAEGRACAGRHGAIRRYLERAGRRQHPCLPDRPELGGLPSAAAGAAPLRIRAATAADVGALASLVEALLELRIHRWLRPAAHRVSAAQLDCGARTRCVLGGGSGRRVMRLSTGGFHAQSRTWRDDGGDRRILRFR